MYAFACGGQTTVLGAPQGITAWLVEIGSLLGLELIEHESFFVREAQGSACSYVLSIRFISIMDHHIWVMIEPWSSGLSGKHLPD